MKLARSALHLPLALWERAGVRETALASSAFHDLWWRWSPWPLAPPPDQSSGLLRVKAPRTWPGLYPRAWSFG
jgi:hypothetical protein